ncbi:putative pectinesterase/pectinesterase inhibitor 28 [Olea europaea var. sylvestris]|uniref:putative pectinesterase/pectinesterase inhibitor 28 n=1 Tax=Olea europaea var. sylvestris TaxID=158386 RepID=UPI000C1D2FB3|nr:putative pectinesterase/pectinesterase inhibitor 28 [Olea europaea var. sylvestris]
MANKKKIGALGISSILLVAMVVALTIGTRENKETDSSRRQDISSSLKAIQTLCGSTDYQETCVDTLKSSDKITSDPKELIELAFEATIKYIEDAAKNSTVLQKLQSNPRAKSALDNCHELANRAVNDLRRSYNKFKEFDVARFNAMLSDLKIWLSGAITYQETCLDGFEDVPGDAEEKMREALKIAMELTSNGLAMVTEISTVIESLGVQGFNNRRLLSEDISIMGHRGEIPDWIDIERRELLSSKPNKIEPDLVVAKDGSGKYSTINQALKDIPKNGNKTFVLYIKEGVYEEKVQFDSSMNHLFVIGDGSTKTKITGHLNFIDGTNTYQTATVAVQADSFMAKDIGFENSAGAEKHQAVALRVSADKAIFYNCQMDGYQDTLYAHTYRQFYRDCVISGTVDFIFGDSAAVFQGCTLVVRKPLDNQQNIVTAQGRKDDEMWFVCF